MSTAVKPSYHSRTRTAGGGASQEPPGPIDRFLDAGSFGLASVRRMMTVPLSFVLSKSAVPPSI